MLILWYLGYKFPRFLSKCRPVTGKSVIQLLFVVRKGFFRIGAINDFIRQKQPRKVIKNKTD